MSALEVPPYGLTLQAPWGALVAWGYKDIENRAKYVATTIGEYRGRIALTASVSHTIGKSSRSFGTRKKPNQDVLHDINDTLDDLIADGSLWKQRMTIGKQRRTLGDMIDMAGKWFATARIEGIICPKKWNPQGWHARGRYGIILRDVVALDTPEPAAGGLGFFEFSRCGLCSRPMAKGSRHRCEVPE